MNGTWRYNKFRLHIHIPEAFYKDEETEDVAIKLANIIQSIEDYANGDKDKDDTIETYDRIVGIIDGQNM